MSQLTLPPVAKSFYTFCKKCDVDRYHIVLAHTSSTTAKIECEVCHSRKSYSLPKTGSSSPSARRLSGQSSTTKKSTSHTGDYEVRVQNTQNSEPLPFSIKNKYVENQKISHVKFGIGFVQKVYPDKIDVVFSDEVKSLVHNRA